MVIVWGVGMGFLWTISDITRNILDFFPQWKVSLTDYGMLDISDGIYLLILSYFVFFFLFLVESRVCGNMSNVARATFLDVVVPFDVIDDVVLHDSL